MQGDAFYIKAPFVKVQKFQSIIRNTQKTLNYLVEDTNEITTILVEEISRSNQNAKKIEKPASMLKLFSEGAKVNSAYHENHKKRKLLLDYHV